MACEVFNRDAGEEAGWVEIDRYIPPTPTFPYWSFFYPDKDGFSSCQFVHIDSCKNLNVREKIEEVIEIGTIPQSEMSNVRSIRGGSNPGGDS